jgi:hypothetical protein
MVVVAGAIHGASIEDPLVSADGTGYTNSRGIGAVCWVGIQFNSDGEEYRHNATASWSGTSQGTWLDAGTKEQVWVVFNRTGGLQTNWDGFTSGTRYQMTSSMGFRLDDTDDGPGTNSIIGSWSFYDAASGGNLLDSTSSGTFIADLEVICGMCCFTPWTLITMADGSQKPIVDIRANDMIRVENGIEPVYGVLTRVDRVMHLIKFADGRVLEASDDHPLYVAGKGYAAVNPDPRGDYKDLGVAKRLEIGDRVLDGTGRTNQIMAIEDMHYPQTVYTFINSKFFANGMLVY